MPFETLATFAILTLAGVVLVLIILKAHRDECAERDEVIREIKKRKKVIIVNDELKIITRG